MLEANTIKQTEMKEKIRVSQKNEKNFSKPSSSAEI